MIYTVTVDRPIGYQDAYGNRYPLNYGFIAGIIGGDGEEQDAYILTETNEPLQTFTGEHIATVIRHDDVEEKWIISDQSYSIEEIAARVHFMEQYFDSEIRKL
jgi:Inorganic pyrophosphatase